ncbi:MAG: S9 family peptidase [Chthonomonadales bacterium]|nr:S9 family peptidase [Chthonomonadales bacterium]
MPRPALRIPAPARRADTRDLLHGIEITDPYRWLEDQNSPETRAWIAEQNAAAEGFVRALPGREGLRERLAALLRTDEIGLPIARAGWCWYRRRRADQELAAVCRRPEPGGPEEVLLDPNGWTDDDSLSAHLLDVSEDGRLVAYGVQRGGEDEMEVRFRDPGAGADLPDVLPRGRYYGGTCLLEDAVLYAIQTPGGPRVRLHPFGSDPADDAEIWGHAYGPEVMVGVEAAPRGRFAVLTAYFGSAATRTEVFVLPLPPTGPPRAVVDELDARFEALLAGDHLYLVTNWQAPNGRVLRVPLDDPARGRWTEVVPEQSAAIRSAAAIGGRLLVERLVDVASRVAVHLPDGMPEAAAPLPPACSLTGISGHWEDPISYVGYTTFTEPHVILRCRPEAGDWAEWGRVRVPIDAARFETQQVWCESPDGTRVPMFLVHAPGLASDGDRPALLTGYGGFNASVTPTFSVRAVAFAERGGIYAVPALRGGGEFGEAWHAAGMRERKQNVFDDFLAAARWLVDSGWTRPERLAIAGSSNGGLLVGAALTQRPDLFRAVVCRVPLLDMLRYHRFLVARFWVPEYGSADDSAAFEYLRAYSPYHNVRDGERYPAVLFMTGDSDTRVDPLHARKMTALLQSATGSGRPVMLLYDTKSGHSGGKPVGALVEEVTDELAFVLDQLGALAPEGGAAGGA